MPKFAVKQLTAVNRFVEQLSERLDFDPIAQQMRRTGHQSRVKVKRRVLAKRIDLGFRDRRHQGEVRQPLLPSREPFFRPTSLTRRTLPGRSA